MARWRRLCRTHLPLRTALPEFPRTFSILGYDPETGEVGGAVQSRVFSVGNGVLWAEADVGVVATQAIVDVSYGPKALALLRDGPHARRDHQGDLGQRSGSGTERAAVAERGPSVRGDGREGQLRGVHRSEGDCRGPGTRAGSSAPRRATFSRVKPSSPAWSTAFEKTTGHLSLRLMAALDAGQAAGGDTRGKQSAAMLIVKKNGGVWLNNDVVLRLQVDDHAEPLKELRRLVEMNARRFRNR